MMDHHQIQNAAESAESLEQRLETTIDIPLSVLVSAAERAIMAYRECHPLAGPTAPGFLMWVEYNAALAEYLTTKGWLLTFEDNVPLLTNPKNQAILTGSAGSAATGIKGGKPQKRSVGDKTKDLVSEGAETLRQLELLLDGTPLNSSYTSGRLPWFGFYHLDKTDRKLRHGLYLPSAMRGSRIIEFEDSIILPAIDLDDVTIASIRDTEADAPVIDFQIERNA